VGRIVIIDASFCKVRSKADKWFHRGAITAFIAFCSCFLIVDWPEQNRFLSADEKALLKRRLAADGGDMCRMDTLNAYAYKRILSDYKIWLG
jgi:hypothetical protein